MRYMICGGAGFIGSNFVHYILETHPEAFVLNYDALTYAGNLDNLHDLKSDPRHTFVHGDICNEEEVDRAVEESRPDVIINFAAETHVDRSIHGGLLDFVHANVLGPQRLAEATHKHKISLLLNVSTDEVYGSLSLDDPRMFTEDTPFAPNMPYAACKAGGDLICRSYVQTFKTPIIVTHCSNNYGPYQFPEKIIPFGLFRAMADEPIPMYGDGLYVRDWIYVRDHCAALDLLVQKGTPGEVYNIGADNERANLDVARMILRILGKREALITHVADRPGHDRRYAIDASKMMRLGWMPEYPREKFEEGLRKTVEWYLGNRWWVEKLRGRQDELNPHISRASRK